MIQTQNSNKDILAKLMATENITIIHKKVSTAYFDVKSRTLCVPILKEEMSPELNDLFVGHEVGHALNTPLEGWHSAVSEKGPIFKGYLNVVEDIRIEKAIKSKYPGLRKSFYAGYKDLANQDFFGIRGKNLHELNLIDRINLFYKIGSITQITFNDEEKPYIDKCENLNTFDDVMKLAVELFERQQNETKDELESLTDQEIQDMLDDMDISQEEEEGDTSDSMTVETEEGDDDEDSNQEGSDAKSDDDNLEDSDDESNSTDSSEGTEEEEEKEDKKNGDEESEEKTDESGSVSNGKDPIEQLLEEMTKSVSDEAFRDMEEGLYDTNEFTDEPVYYEIPKKINYGNYIVGYKEIFEIFNTKSYDGTTFDRTKVQPAVKEFTDSNKKIISYMVKEFEMKKAASAYKRSWSSKSGELNMDKIFNYKLKDDIFNRVQVTPDGKNHGVTMLLDWSGSMSGSVKATVEQATLLSMFCRRLSIPFTLFAFSDSYERGSGYPEEIHELERSDNDGDWSKAQKMKEVWRSAQMFGEGSKVDWSVGTVRLLEVFSNKMSNKEFNTSIENWFQLADSIEGRYLYNTDNEDFGYDQNFSTPTKLHLSGTPLDHSLILMRDYLIDFKRDYNLDICSLITLTDGASHGVFNRYGKANLVDRVNNKVFTLNGDTGRHTHKLLEWIKETVGVRTIGFYIANCAGRNINWEATRFTGGDINNYGQEADRKSKEFNALSTSYTEGSYDLAILINQKKLKLNYNEDELNVKSMEDGANKGTLKRALVKAGSNKMKQRVILNQFVGQMAV